MADPRPSLTIGVALKWVDLRPEVDPLTGAVSSDARFHGVSAADQAALEWALQLRDAWSDAADIEVHAVSVGHADADAALRDAVAAGADAARRVELDSGSGPKVAGSDHSDGRPGPQPSSVAVATALASATADCDIVICGDWSLDRGSGSVPAFLAGMRSARQALGVVAITAGHPGELVVERRLDFGRRERLAVTLPAVLSVEGGTARPRRADMAATLRARSAPVEMIAAADLPPTAQLVNGPAAPYRPRARVLDAPGSDLSARERILALTGALVERTPPQTVRLEPDAAADLIIDTLVDWGHLEPRRAVEAASRLSDDPGRDPGASS